MIPLAEAQERVLAGCDVLNEVTVAVDDRSGIGDHRDGGGARVSASVRQHGDGRLCGAVGRCG